MTAERISVIIITSGRADFVFDAINSVVDQSIKVDEIIVVNNSHRVFDESRLSEPDRESKIAILNLPPCGPSLARNIGANRATGDILFFLDDDDLFRPGHVASNLALFRSGAEMIITNYQEFGNGEGSSNLTPERLCKESFFLSNAGALGSTISIRNVIFRKLGGFDFQLLISEDKDLFLRALQGGYRIMVNSERNVLRRVHSNQLSESPVGNVDKTVSKMKFHLKHADSMSLLLRIKGSAETRILQLYFYPSWSRFVLSIFPLMALFVTGQTRYLRAFLNLKGKR